MEFTVRRSLFAVLLCVGVLAPSLVIQPSTAAAAPPLDCARKTFPFLKPPETGPEQSFRICTGRVKTKDQTGRLDVTVTLPPRGDGPFPLVVLLHGLGGSKYSYESTFIEGEGGRRHYNNLWFAAQGYMVLTYTARGWDLPNPASESPCIDRDPQSVDDDSAEEQVLYSGPSPACYIQIAHLRHEIVDTQYLVGRLVDGTLLDAPGVRAQRKIGVTGVSYGGGQTWLLTRKNQWKSPKGATVRVGAAAPLIGWTDILDALAPNGRASDEDPPQSFTDRAAEPIGVKNDYVDVFYDAVKFRGTDFIEVVDYLKDWKTAFDFGEPYTGPIIEDAVTKLLKMRSAYFVPKKNAFDTPILAIQGFTDGIFPAVQALKMYNKLQAEPTPPEMKLYLGDWGHPPAQNKQAETNYIAALVNDWFRFYLKGKGDQPPLNVEARTNECDSDEIGELYRGPDWASLENPALAWVGTGPDGSVATPAGDPHAQTLVPSDGSADNDPNGVPDSSCRRTDSAVDEDNYSHSWLLSGPPAPVTMMGLPEVSLTANPSDGDADMYVAAHLWDVDHGISESPDDDRQTLVTRGIYRLDGDEAQPVSFKLFGNAYTFPDGHSIKLELTADDGPSFQTYKKGTEEGEIDISNVSLTIPRADCTMSVATPCE